MAFASNGNVRLHWQEEGYGPPLLLLNSVGCDLTLWDTTIPFLTGFRIIRMDMRGHGQSSAPPGDYTLDELAGDIVTVLDAVGAEQAILCGLSLGGMTAMTLALTAPKRVASLILACTSAQVDREIWNARIVAVKSRGMAAIADAVMARFFSDQFRRDHPPEVAAIREKFLSLQPEGFAGCCAAIRDMSLLGSISAIEKPTLVIVGEKDVATPLQGHGDAILARIAGSRVSTLPSGHLAPVEAPQAFANSDVEFQSNR